jgi:hypothetical protein
MIVGICGLIGSGKGTAADYLVNELGYTKLSFADKLKDAVATMFSWDRTLLEGDTKESREWREHPDEFWTKETGKTITPRLVLQLFGTDCMRNGFYDGIWVSLVKQQIVNNPDKNFVIPDVRFQNEVKTIRDVGGKVWWVKRGELPAWWSTAILDNKNSEMGFKATSMQTSYEYIHPSEWKWANTDDAFDAIIHNDFAIDRLYEQIDLKISD